MAKLLLQGAAAALALLGGAVLNGTVLAPAARAEVVAQADNGFVVRRAADVSGDAAGVWKILLQPSEWWNPQHSYSGDANKLQIDARVGGCFCETLPGPDGSANGVEHLRIISIEADRALRLSGGLGPLQAEAVHGTLTIVLKPDGDRVRIMWEYVVGGYLRQKVADIAPMVDAVLGEQLARLAARIEGRDVTAASAPKPRKRPAAEEGR